MTNLLFTAKMKLADILIDHPRLIIMLSRFGIELGFGDKNVEEVCKMHKVSTDFFLILCNVYTFQDYLPSKSELKQINMNEMISYLLASHDYYLNNQLVNIELNMNEITKSCNPSNGDILKRFFSEYKIEVIKHFKYEEEIVFPYIKDLLNGKKSSAYNIHQFEENHSNIEDKLTDLINIILKYLPNGFAQKERVSVLSSLFILSEDLTKHSLIEDKILAPYVETLERDGSK